MKILESNKNENSVEYINKNDIYVYITDYGAIFLLVNIVLEAGFSTWSWLHLRTGTKITLKTGAVKTFEKVINNAVNDIYSTVYNFASYSEMVDKWDEIAYKDVPKTVYKSVNNE